MNARLRCQLGTPLWRRVGNLLVCVVCAVSSVEHR